MVRVLIIDGNLYWALTMKRRLENIGFHVELSNKGMDGEEKAFAKDYDVILLDINLPDIDGLEIISFLRNSKRNTPVIISTACANFEQIALGLDLGADDFLIRPFQLDELRARIQTIVRRFRGHTRLLNNMNQLDISSFNFNNRESC
ncbi:response regulator transcription factor [Bacillus sp. 1P06AnD]|uniref:response regulator transcription factor n=1 Tax=Bacillus sp. 1P06AnD TaxID=3132208 RepID=UPI0039A2EAE6